VSSSAIVALAGGVGGAKLADGLSAELPRGALTVVVNTADDFVIHGLHVSPDLDTVMYTLAGLANPATGWGIVADTFNSLSMLGRYGAPDWFGLGDRDIATHILRTAALRGGETLTAVTRQLAAALGIDATILPMCDQSVRTIIGADEGEFAFQEYFVLRRARDHVRSIRLKGIEAATVSDEVRAAVEQCSAIVFCPSNPFVSIAPILAVPGLRDAIVQSAVPIVAVSPIVAGQALKGPAAQMLESLGNDVSVVGVADQYADLGVTLLIDEVDREFADAVAARGVRPVIAPIVMQSAEDRRSLARLVIAVAQDLAAEAGSASGDSAEPGAGH
jgi:LPPG:FO 2-phospho-L-lactate transferase